MQDGLPEAPSQICPVCVRNAANSFAHLLGLLALTILCLAEFISWDLVQPLVSPAKLAPSAPSSPDDVGVVRVRPGGFVLQMPPYDSTSRPFPTFQGLLTILYAASRLSSCYRHCSGALPRSFACCVFLSQSLPCAATVCASVVPFKGCHQITLLPRSIRARRLVGLLRHPYYTFDYLESTMFSYNHRCI